MTVGTALHFSRHLFWTLADVSLSALAVGFSWLGSRCRDGGAFCAGKRGAGSASHVD